VGDAARPTGPSTDSPTTCCLGAATARAGDRCASRIPSGVTRQRRRAAQQAYTTAVWVRVGDGGTRIGVPSDERHEAGPRWNGVDQLGERHPDQWSGSSSRALPVQRVAFKLPAGSAFLGLFSAVAAHAGAATALRNNVGSAFFVPLSVALTRSSE
jgi:hypothetical protein